MILSICLILEVLTYLFLAGSLGQIEILKIFLCNQFQILIFPKRAYKLFIELTILTVIVVTELRHLPRRKLYLFVKLNINVEVFLFQRHVWLV
jgi:hypothetical protein